MNNLATANFPYPYDHFGAELQAYFNMLSNANRAEGRATYTVVLWTGPSGKAKAEEIADLTQNVPALAYGQMARPNGYYYTGSKTSFEC